MKLGIVVPYRDRESHLAAFIAHVSAYFSRDKLASQIDYRVLVVEQDYQKPFNRGAVKNVGFKLLEPSVDYVCFHDVDYLPIWADYSPVTQPTAIVWYGAETRPVAPGRSTKAIHHKLDEFYGGAVLIDNASFRAVDGYANDYWGWGYEDSDLRSRFDEKGILWDRRKGTFSALDHDNDGYTPVGEMTEIGLYNGNLYASRYQLRTVAPGPGLEKLNFTIHSREPIASPRLEGDATWEIVKVRLNGKPSDEQKKALKL